MADVFISHSSKDNNTANQIVSFLESRGISCWIAPRDIIPGTDWAASISAAINESKAFLVVYSANCAASEQCARELAIAETRKGILIVPYRTDDSELRGSFQYYLIGSHWVVADPEHTDTTLGELCDRLSEVTGKTAERKTEAVSRTISVETNVYTPTEPASLRAEPTVETVAHTPAEPAPKPAAPTAVCPGCGAVMPANARFCNICGRRISAAAERRDPAQSPAASASGFPQSGVTHRSPKKYRFTVAEGRWSCEYCGRWNSFNHPFCRLCGELRDEATETANSVIFWETWLCKLCGTTNAMPDIYCRKCRNVIGSGNRL